MNYDQVEVASSKLVNKTSGKDKYLFESEQVECGFVDNMNVFYAQTA